MSSISYISVYAQPPLTETCMESYIITRLVLLQNIKYWDESLKLLENIGRMCFLDGIDLHSTIQQKVPEEIHHKKTIHSHTPTTP
jgi:hypothetical protein